MLTWKAFVLKILYHLWGWVWIVKCWHSCSHTSICLRLQVNRCWFQKPPLLFYASSWLCFMSRRTRCMNAISYSSRWLRILWIYLVVYWQFPSSEWKSGEVALIWTWTIIWVKRGDYWTSKDIPGWTRSKSSVGNWIQMSVIQFISIFPSRCKERRWIPWQETQSRRHDTAVSEEGRNTCDELLKTWVWHDTWSDWWWCLLLSIADWYLEVYCWVGMSRYLPRGVNDGFCTWCCLQ